MTAPRSGGDASPTPGEDAALNPYAPPAPVTAPRPPSLAARGLALVFGALGLGAWASADGDNAIGRFSGLMTAGMYCLPMAVAAIVLGGNVVRRGQRVGGGWLAIGLGVIGCLGMAVSVARVVMR